MTSLLVTLVGDAPRLADNVVEFFAIPIAPADAKAAETASVGSGGQQLDVGARAVQ